MIMNIDQIIKEYLEKKQYDTRTEMCNLFEKNKSDKSLWHNYTTFYDKIFESYIDREINFFELGLGSNNSDVVGFMGKNARPGASLYAFRDYFKNANICGADIDDRVLFNDKGIWTFYVDQTDSDTIKDLWDNFEDTKFNIIIDDGLHDYDANIIFFENSIDILEDSGIYIIEDIDKSVVSKYEKYFEKIKDQYSYANIFTLPITQEWADYAPHPWKGRKNTFDNTLGIIIK